jgi:DNA (cytosine-5)-methyltransferase 1
MRYGSVCSGIEAATAAWHHLGWEPAFFSEIEAFPSAVLTHHYPTVPLHGDFTTIEKNQYGKIDLLVGGTPCQSFSVAGLRGGLDDERGNLALEFCRLAQREQPRWIVWENVPGVLSSNGGRDFGSILGALEDLGYGLAYRVLDAQYFGVAQRRRRVFVVGYLGDWRPAAAVLFERHSMSGHPAPSREARKEAARNAAVSTHECGGIGSYNESDVSSPLLRSGADNGHGCEAPVTAAGVAGPDLTGPLTAGMHKAPRGTEGVESNHIVPVSQPYSIMPMNSGKDYKARETDVAQPIMAGGPVGGNQGGDYIVQAYDILGVPATQGAKPTEVHTALRARAPGQSEASTTTVILQRDNEPTVVPFDTTQVTSPHNYSNPKAGDPCHPLAAGAHPPAIIAFSAKDHGADATEELAPTLRAGGFTGSRQNGGVMPAVAIGFNGDQSEKTRSMGEQKEQAPTLRAGAACHVATIYTAMDDPVPPLMARSSRGGAQTLSPGHQTDGHMVAVAYDHPGRFNNIHGGSGEHRDVMPTLEATNPKQIVAHSAATPAIGWSEELTASIDLAGTLQRGGSGGRHDGVMEPTSAVRRLTPVECERLQGFPDNFTAIPWRKKGAEDCPDGPRYKALGNSMAVPVMRWIGERIHLVDDLVSLI